MWSSRAGESPVFALKADFFRVLGHPVRVRTLQLLRDGELSVGALVGGDVLGASFHSAIVPAFGLDPLSGFFVAVLAVTAVPTLVFARDYLPASAGARAVGSLTAAFLLSLVGVLAARDVTTFL